MTTTRADFQGRRAVVFGARGFMGSHLVSALAERGATVVAFDRNPPVLGSRHPGIEAVVGDIRDPRQVAASVQSCQHIFAFAGGLGARGSLVDPVVDLETSCNGQLVLLDSARRNAPEASIVFLGSRLEYGKPRYLPVDEAHPLLGDSPYAIHKSAACAYHRIYASQYGLRTVVLRLPNPYGVHVAGAPERRLYGVLNIFIDRVLSGRPLTIYGDGAQQRDFIHVADVIRAALIASQTPGPGGNVFNIGSGEPVSLLHAAELIASAAGRGTIEHCQWPTDASSLETGDFYFDISKAGSQLGWSPSIALNDGIRQVVDEMIRDRGQP